jgi:betaine-aldehyde dehydrogenase
MEAASRNLKKVTLELGGKNPAIFFEDCDMDIAIDWDCLQAYANQGPGMLSRIALAGARIYL